MRPGFVDGAGSGYRPTGGGAAGTGTGTHQVLRQRAAEKDTPLLDTATSVLAERHR